MEKFKKDNPSLSGGDLIIGLHSLVSSIYEPELKAAIDEVLAAAAIAAKVSYAGIWTVFYVTKVVPNDYPMACVRGTLESLNKIDAIDEWNETIAELTAA